MRPAALSDRRFEERQVRLHSGEIRWRRRRGEDQAHLTRVGHGGARATAPLRAWHDPHPFGLRAGAAAISELLRKPSGGALGLLSSAGRAIAAEISRVSLRPATPGSAVRELAVGCLPAVAAPPVSAVPFSRVLLAQVEAIP